MVRYINATRGAVLAESARIADNFFTRLRGLLFSRPLAEGEALFLSPCKQIHMFGMTYAIDCLFVDGDGVVVGMAERIGPNGVSAFFKKASGCLELPAGTIAVTGTSLGDTVTRQ